MLLFSILLFPIAVMGLLVFVVYDDYKRSLLFEKAYNYIVNKDVNVISTIPKYWEKEFYRMVKRIQNVIKKEEL